MQSRIRVLIPLLLLLPPHAFAQSPYSQDYKKAQDEMDQAVIESLNLPSEVDAACKANPKACKLRSRLTAFKPNYAIIQDSEDDEESIEVRYSFRYQFTRPHCLPGHDLIIEITPEESLECIREFNTRWESYFSFTGEFDFYMGTRDSGPVINRVSNPAFHYREYFANETFRWVDFSVQHRSNGQVTEIDELAGNTLRTQIAFDEGDDEYFDGLSRGANFYKIETLVKPSRSANLYLSAKLYINDDSEVNWGPDAADDPSIRDYDVFEVIYQDTWNVGGRILESSFEWHFGEEGTDTDSFDLDFLYPIRFGDITIPFYLRLHKGPFKTLSNYTVEQDTIGIGIKLKP